MLYICLLFSLVGCVRLTFTICLIAIDLQLLGTAI